jgi:hypothetical protein
MADPLHRFRYSKGSYLICHKKSISPQGSAVQISWWTDHKERLLLFFRPPPARTWPTPNGTTTEPAHGVVPQGPQGESILVVYSEKDAPSQGNQPGVISFPFLSHFVCLVHISFRQFPYDFESAFKPFYGCATRASGLLGCGSIVRDISFSV